MGAAPAPWRAIGHNPHDQWLTPKWITDALGEFDLDPCAANPRDWDIGTTDNYTEDGLEKPWYGRAFVNPPYSDVGPWLKRLREHGDGIALVFARTETRWFCQHVWPHATGLLFVEGRLRFIRGDDLEGPGHNATSASVLVAYGVGNAIRLSRAAASGSIRGRFIMSFKKGFLY